MALWNGNLRNAKGDVAIDSIILVAIVVTYAVQIIHVTTRGSKKGISPYFLLFNSVFSNAQLSEALLLVTYAWPNDKKPLLQLLEDRHFRCLAAFGSVLGVLQIAMLWACSTILIVVFSFGYTNGGPLRTGFAASAFLHAVIFLFPIFGVALSKPPPHQFGTDILIALTTMTNRFAAPLFVVLQFYPQYLERRRSEGEPGCLSLLSLGLQSVVLAAVAFRWLLRLGEPTWSHQSAPLWLWYQWGELPFNYILNAVGCAALLSAYLFGTSTSGREAGVTDQKTSLVT